MPEKRAAPDDHGDNKRAKPGNAALNIQEKMAEVKARAAAAKAKIVAATSGASQPTQQAKPAQSKQRTASSRAPSQKPTPQDRDAERRARLEALKASIATATAKQASSTLKQDTEGNAQESESGDSPGIGDRSALSKDSQVGTSNDGRLSSILGNRKGQMTGDGPSAQAKQFIDLEAPPLEELKQNPYFDPSLGGGRAMPKSRKTRELVLNAQGKYQAQAAALRRQAHTEDLKRRIAEGARLADLKQDKSEQGYLVKDVPDIEWWDEGLVEGATYPDFSSLSAELKLKITTDDTIVTRYIQHPVLLDPVQDSLAFKAKPMPLTKVEQKKLRRQTRMADLKEKQAKVRLGLEAPEPPKIKKSNLMRVLGEQAVKDPTAVEARVNREIAERAQKHEDMNQARKVTKEDREAKARANAEADAAKGIVACAFRIGSLAFGKNRAKILMESKWSKDLTGMLLTHPLYCILVVEAGRHTVDRFKKLMLRRIKWTDNKPASQSEQHDAEHGRAPPPPWLRPVDENGQLKDLSQNSCEMLWEGEQKERRFMKWSARDFASEGEARQALERNKMEHVLTKAKNWSPPS